MREMGLYRLYKVCKDARRTRITDGPRDFAIKGYGYNEWGNVKCFGNNL